MMAVMKGDGHPAPRMRTQNSMRSARAATSINEHSDDDGGGRAWGDARAEADDTAKA